MRISHLSAVLFSAVLLASCISTNPATGGRMFTAVSEEQEYNLGAQTVQAAIKEEGLYKEDEALYDYYKALGARLFSVTERQDKPLEFLMLDSATYNAWATPGYVNVYRGILPYLNSEAELVGVMAHEAGHVNARHTARGMTNATLANILVVAAATTVAVTTDSNDAANLAALAGGVGAALAINGYSRSYEREADSLALRYMGKMGYDPRELVHLFQSMAAYEKYYDAKYALFNNGELPPRTPFYHLLLSHPEPTEREANVEAEVGEPDGSVRLPAGVQPATTAADPQGRQRYLNRINGIAFGPKPDDGVASASHLYNRKHRFVWQLPANMAMEWNGTRWEGINTVDNTKLAVSFAYSEKDEPDYDPEEALRILFPKARNVEKASVDGRIAYTAEADDEKGRRNRVVVLPSGETSVNAAKGRAFIVLAFRAPAGKDADIRASLNHFTYLGKTRADRIQPLRLRVVTVQPGDTLQSLSDRMATNTLPKQQFMAMNNLTENTPLVPGMQVKLIVDENRL